MAIVPSDIAHALRAFCTSNPQALPLIEVGEPGQADGFRSAPSADVRTDLPLYQVFVDGVLVSQPTDIADLWTDDLVVLLIGCSFTAERLLMESGVELGYLQHTAASPVYRTTIDCTPTAGLHCTMAVSMRPIATESVQRATDVTAQLPLAHGAPVHIGDPAAIGIVDLARPDWGGTVEVPETHTPVFWACGVTLHSLIDVVKPPLAITHAPAHMFVTDVTDSLLIGAPTPLFASN